MNAEQNIEGIRAHQLERSFQLITIAQELDYIPPGFELFASTGCKGVQHRVIHFLKGGVSEEGDDDIAELAKIASDKRQIPDEQLRIA